MDTMNDEHAARKTIHDTLDKVLDLLKAQGYDNEDIVLQVRGLDIEDDDVLIEDFYNVTVEFASGSIEEAAVEHEVYKNQTLSSQTRTTIEL